LELLKSISELQETLKSSSLTIGTFDGMHKGHLHLISELKKTSKSCAAPSVVVTFNPNPFTVLNNMQKQEYHLIEDTDKYEILNSMGVDFLLELNFDRKMANISAKDFLRDFIVTPFNPQSIIIGYDHHFGKDRIGNKEFLTKNQSTHGYNLKVVGPFKIEDEIISSSLIRKLIREGNVATANRHLGRNYKVGGKIIEGDSIGRELDFPTANIDISAINQIIPKNGVYFIKTKINEDNYYGMCNIGRRPTVSSENKVSMEVHIFNYSDFDLYAQFIEIEFVDYVRNEKKFKNTEELKSQLIKDKGYCERLQF